MTDLPLFGVALAQCVSWGVLFYTFAVVAEPMRLELGATRTAVAGAFSLGLALTGVAGIVCGRLIETRGLRSVVTCGSVAGSLLVLAWASVSSMPALYLVWAGLGVAAATLFYEPAFAWASARYRTGRDRALTAITFLGGLASVVFVPLGTALVGNFGWRGALVVLGLLLGAVTIPIHAWALALPTAEEAKVEAEALPPEAPALSLAEALRTTRFWALGGSFFASNFVTIALTVFLLPWLGARGFAPGSAAAVLAAFGAVQAPGRLFGGRWLLARGLGTQLALPFAVQALGLALLLAARSPPLALAAMGCFGLGNGLITLARAGSVRITFGLRHYASIGGAMGAFPAASRALAPVVTALLIGEAGRYTGVFTAFALGLAVLALGCAVVLPGRKRRGTTHSAASG